MNDFALLILRTVSSIFMLFAHGLPKLNRLFPSDEISFADPLGIGTVPSLALAVFSEFFCSVFIFLGLFTRASLIALIITMFVAGFIHHAADPFAQKEKALLFLLIYLFLFITGPGKYSLNRIIKIKSSIKLIKFLSE
ncbi:Putative membrane protein [Ignavibacterium album JCM 16511]|uniref:Putative membrane protein n=1 Tax=Ignavibacterium album (strain DSM 19864 / JCM 16511 / NBRC 101810 / Mat9-16) TaxID=945713 RepID=I0AFJ7_IGNAJ|nr:DoxX family protein [Ignavibacterium album]AFH47754.1 Putative membrane protein [Ignavibacterium album JCM 16511]